MYRCQERDLVGEDRSSRRMRAAETEADENRRHHEVHPRWNPRNLIEVVRIKAHQANFCVVSVRALDDVTHFCVLFPCPFGLCPSRRDPSP